MDLAPIVLFVYNRPFHTRRTLEALRANELADHSQLYVYLDGPKENATESDIALIKEVKSIVTEENWCKEVSFVQSQFNQGLAKAVIRGVTEVIKRHGKVIVLEDDLVTSRGFLRFMNEALRSYNGVQNVWSVCGYMFPLVYKDRTSVLLPYISTWGWGTWEAKWIDFVTNKPNFEVLENSVHLSRHFNLSDYDYVGMLKHKKESTWGIRWYFHVFSYHGLSVFPTASLVANIGKDGTGTNYKIPTVEVEPRLVNEISVQKSEKVDLAFWHLFLDYFSIKPTVKKSFLNVLLEKIHK